MSQVLEEALPGHPVCALSGPSFALEVFQRQPTAVVAAASRHETAETVQAVFATPRFRVYSSRDVVGVELGGALKNVIAIAAGILEGLGLGNNPRAALITRGLGGDDPAGCRDGGRSADLCRPGRHGRSDPHDHRCAQPQSRPGHGARGRPDARTVRGSPPLDRGGRQHRQGRHRARDPPVGVELPICEQVAGILFDGKPARQAVVDLMERTLKSEQWR